MVRDPQAVSRACSRGGSDAALTSSWVSAWKVALTPMMKGVGVLSTSRSCAGRMGT